MIKNIKLCNRSIGLFIIFCFSILIFSRNTEAAIQSSDYIGRYYIKGGYKTATEEHSSYNVTIKQIKNGKVKFQVSYCGAFYSPLYDTNIITAKIKGNKASFKWEDSWENKGKGTIQFVKKGTIKLNMKETKESEFNRATLATSGSETLIRYTKKH